MAKDTTVRVVSPADEGEFEQSRWLKEQLAKQRATPDTDRIMGSYGGFASIPGHRDGVITHHEDGTATLVLSDGTTYVQDRGGHVRKVAEVDSNVTAAAFLQTLRTPAGIKPAGVTAGVAGTVDQFREASSRALAREGAAPTLPDMPGVAARRPGLPGRPGQRPLGPEVATNQAKSLLESFKGAETYEGEKLLRQFPILFDNTQAVPVSLMQAGLAVVAVKTGAEHGKIAGVPEYASYLGRKFVPGIKEGMVSFFVVDKASVRQVEKDVSKGQACVVDSFDRDGIYVGAHAGGVSMFGPGLGFAQGLNYANMTARAGVYGEVNVAIGNRRAPTVDLSEQGANRSLNVIKFPNKVHARKAFMASFVLPPEFGRHPADVRIWRDICEKFGDLTRRNSCLPLIHGNTLTVMTNLEDATALESHEDVSMVMHDMHAYLRNLSTQTEGRVRFDARLYQSTVTCDSVEGQATSPVVRGNWSRYSESLAAPRFENQVYADKNCPKFDRRKDPRQRFVATEFEPVRGVDNLFFLSKIDLIKDRVGAGQVYEFVGRDAEVEQMKAILQQSATEGLQTCLVEGHTGAGKTALVLRVAAQEVRASNTIVLAFRNRDNLAALADLVKGVLGIVDLSADVDKAADPEYVKYSNLLKNFVSDKRAADYRYDEDQTIDAIVHMFQYIGRQMALLEQKCMLMLDDFDAAGPKMRSILLKLLGKLRAKGGDMKGVNVFGTIRSGQDHAGNAEADRIYVAQSKEALSGNKLAVSEFTLRTAEDGYAPWLNEFIIKRCLRISPDLAKPIETADLTRIGMLCSKMASVGGQLHDEKTAVSAHSLKLIVDNLRAEGFLTVDTKIKPPAISCSQQQYDAAEQAISGGRLPCGPEEIYKSQLLRAKADPAKMNILYLAAILRGVDYRVLESEKIAAFLGPRLGLADAAGFTKKMDELRIKHDGSDADSEGILSAGAELDMHTLWRNQVQEAMKEETGDKMRHVKELAFRALLAAKREPSLAQHVDAVMLFDIALELGHPEEAKNFVFAAIVEAMQGHNYIKAKECALFAQAQFAGDTAKLCEANFHLAKAYLYSRDVNNGKAVLKDLVVPHKNLLTPALQIELIEIFLERFRLDVIEREVARDGAGMRIALGDYDRANAAMSRNVDSLRVHDAEAQEAAKWAAIAVKYHEIEALYKKAVRGALGEYDVPLETGGTKRILSAVDLAGIEGVSDQDKGFQLAINKCEELLRSLEADTDANDKVDVMKAKVSQLLSAIVLQKNRQLVDSDEERLALKAQEDPQTHQALERVVQLCNRVLLIARQRGGLGADYSVEARSAAGRFYAAAFLEFDGAELQDFIRVAYEYLLNVDPADAEIHLGNMYCGAIANLFRRNLVGQARTEMANLAVDIAELQYLSTPERWDRMFNYVESLLFRASDERDQAAAVATLQEAYNVLKRVADEKKQLPEAGKEDYRFLSMLLIARHKVLSDARGVKVTAEGETFDYKHLLIANKPVDVNDNALVTNRKQQADGSTSEAEKTMFYGRPGMGAEEVRSWPDLIEFGKYPALAHLYTSLRR